MNALYGGMVVAAVLSAIGFYFRPRTGCAGIKADVGNQHLGARHTTHTVRSSASPSPV